MVNPIKVFQDDDSGAVTVDWVVLSAAVIGMGLVALKPIAFSTESATSKVSEDVSSVPVGFENQ